MKRFTCEGFVGTTITSHTLRGQGTITLTFPNKKKQNKKKIKNLSTHFFGHRFRFQPGRALNSCVTKTFEEKNISIYGPEKDIAFKYYVPVTTKLLP